MGLYDIRYSGKNCPKHRFNVLFEGLTQQEPKSFGCETCMDLRYKDIERKISVIQQKLSRYENGEWPIRR